MFGITTGWINNWNSTKSACSANDATKWLPGRFIRSRLRLAFFTVVGLTIVTGCSEDKLAAAEPEMQVPETTVPEMSLPEVEVPEMPLPEIPVVDGDLRSSLSAAMSGNRVLEYSTAWSILAEGAEVSSGSIRLFYTRRVIPTENRASGPDQAEVDYWNREHIWPRSYGLRGTPAENDMHNLVPTDLTVNQARDNKFFDEATVPDIECTLCGVSNEAWEPPPEVQGDVARIVFYMDVRYEGVAQDGVPDLVLADDIDASAARFGRLSTLVRWHCADPVSVEEVQRHESVARMQGNRNAFIDAPDLASEVYGFTCSMSN